MPMDFPDLNSLKQYAECHKFRQPNKGETEDAYRTALADHVQPRDYIESLEIRNKVGWDKFSPAQNRDMLRRCSLDVQRQRSATRPMKTDDCNQSAPPGSTASTCSANASKLRDAQAYLQNATSGLIMRGENQSPLLKDLVTADRQIEEVRQWLLSPNDKVEARRAND